MLTIKQEKFCLKYIETGNATASYKYAYNSEKMKPETINNKAFELLKNGGITARIEVLKAKLEATAIMSAQEVLKRLTDFAKSDEIEVKDSLKACELLGKHLKLFTDRLEVKGKFEVIDPFAVECEGVNE